MLVGSKPILLPSKFLLCRRKARPSTLSEQNLSQTSPHLLTCEDSIHQLHPEPSDDWSQKLWRPTSRNPHSGVTGHLFPLAGLSLQETDRTGKIKSQVHHPNSHQQVRVHTSEAQLPHLESRGSILYQSRCQEQIMKIQHFSTRCGTQSSVVISSW